MNTLLHAKFHILYAEHTKKRVLRRYQGLKLEDSGAFKHNGIVKTIHGSLEYGEIPQYFQKTCFWYVQPIEYEIWHAKEYLCIQKYVFKHVVVQVIGVRKNWNRIRNLCQGLHEFCTR